MNQQKMRNINILLRQNFEITNTTSIILPTGKSSTTPAVSNRCNYFQMLY